MLRRGMVLWVFVTLLFPSPLTAQSNDSGTAVVSTSTVADTDNHAESDAAARLEPESGEDLVALSSPETINFTEYLVLPAVGSYGRAPLHRDAVEAQLVSGQWTAPTAGEEVTYDGQRRSTWKAASTDKLGILDTRYVRGGYAYVTIESPSERVMLLEARGHAAVYVNGKPRTGDPYSLGWVRLPVQVRQGVNQFLFHVSDSSLSARLMTASGEVLLDDADLSLPTHRRGASGALWAAVPIINASTQELAGARLVCEMEPGGTLTTPVPTVPPLSLYKAAFELNVQGNEPQVGTLRLLAAEANGAGTKKTSAPASELQELAMLKITVLDVDRDQVQLHTFRSSIDGSVQRYAFRAAHSHPDRPEAVQPGTILALHGAGNDCQQFAKNFSVKSWTHIVVPEGRRAYGFDWEDWSRVDALEALTDAQRRYDCDPQRTYLTGHSMGGHGAWHLGVAYPSRFAAVGPISAWASFWSYGGGMPVIDETSPLSEMLQRAYAPSDTLNLLGNLRQTGVCIVHGQKDEEVPVEQARFMRSRLSDFHGSFSYFEEAERGHWWGPETCDSPRMMDFFSHERLPSVQEIESVDFTTANPAVSHGSAWVSIEAQEAQLQPSRVAILQDTDSRHFVAKTINVARLAIDLGHLDPSRPVTVELDGTVFSQLDCPAGDTRLWFDRHSEEWQAIEEPSPRDKGPHRYGTFKSVFDNDPVLVYGTRGSREENQWSKAKARYDAETFWYRGNGSLEVVADSAFQTDAYPDRNVVIYGNAETNAAWPLLLSTCPLQVRSGRAQIGVRPEVGDDLAVLFVYPRPASDRALVGVVGGTGPVGMQLTSRLRYFISGVAYPDLLIFGPGVLTQGTDDVRVVGFFGLDWKVDSGEIMWRDVAF